MQTTSSKWPIYLVNKNKKIRVCHYKFGQTSNIRMIRNLKLLINIRSFDNAYNLIEILRDFEQSNLNNNYNYPKHSNGSNHNYVNYPKYFNNSTPVYTNETYFFTFFAKVLVFTSPSNNDFDNLFTPYIASKQTYIVIHNKLITKLKQKLKKVYVNLWRPYYPLLLLKKTYMVILLDAKTWRFWVIYLQSKDEFVNVFQTWLLTIKT